MESHHFCPLLEEPIEVDIAETEATDSGDVEELMADPDMEDADESDVLHEETEVDAGEDEDEVCILCLSDYSAAVTVTPSGTGKSVITYLYIIIILPK